jgi:hypothetical protein
VARLFRLVRSRSIFLVRSRSIFAACALAASVFVISPVPASAQGFFEMMFGAPRRAAPPPPPAYADPRFDGRDARGNYDAPRQRQSGGSGIAHCVRLCDGRHFPIGARGGASPAEICSSFCPAAQTQVYFGGAIDHATGSNGRRYSDLPNAFLYRETLVDGCTCDGKSPVGLVRQDIDADPTLRVGDVVATTDGLMAYRGERRRAANFTPVDTAPGFSAAMRKQLSATRILPERTTEELGAAPAVDGSADAGDAAAGERAAVGRNDSPRLQAASR